jgi:hypothetical protein
VTRDSQYGRTESNVACARALAANDSRVEFVVGRPDARVISEADIVTNLGFVRPIDASFVQALKATAVIPLMCEAWECRAGDVDLAACATRGIPVLGTNEDAPGVEVFSFAGPLAGALLLEAGLEILKSDVVVVSPDRFGPVIAGWLARAGARVTLLASLRTSAALEAIGRADAVLLADYSRDSLVIGDGGDLTSAAFARSAPGATVVQFAGALDASGLRRCGIAVFPPQTVGPVRMARTLAHVGPRPVIELHTAGLKVGQLAAQARRRGESAIEIAQRLPREEPLVQAVLPGTH